MSKEELDQVTDEELEQELEEEEDRGDDVDPDLPDLDDDADEDHDDDGEGDGEDETPAKPEKSGSKMVPHSRFNEVNDALKAEREARLHLEEELARARGTQPKPEPAKQQEQAPAFDFDEAEDRYMDAVMEGDTAAARAIRAEIRKEDRAEAERAATFAVDQRRAQEDQARETQSLQQTAAELYKKYPQLNGAGDKADHDLIEMTLALRNKYIQNGERPADALRKAATKVCGEVDLVDDDDDPDETPRQRMVKRNLERANRIPPREIGSGERSRPVDYSELSEEEFDKLPEREKRKARGDFI